MTSGELGAGAAPSPENPDRARARPVRRILAWRWMLFWAAFAAVLLPTLYANYTQSWSSEQGEQGPIVLGIAAWLLWRRWPEMAVAGRPGSVGVAIAVFGLSALAYVFGRIADQFAVETYGLYGLGLATTYALVGLPGMARGWFPLAFFLFVLPVPYTLTLLLTSHLRLWITEAVVATLRLCGLSIVRDGLNILVDQYLLAVQEACSGMNSLFSLSAIGLVYLHIRRSPPWWYYAVMFGPIIFFAVAGNFTRIIVLVLMTHFLGDAVAQGVLHETTGIITFAVALIGVMVLDAIVGVFVFSDRRRPAQ